MKSIVISTFIGLSLLAQLSLGSTDLKNVDSKLLIQQARQLRVSIREHLKKIGHRMNQTQVMSLSGSMSGFFSGGHVAAEGFEILKETEWYYFETMNSVDIESIENRLYKMVQEYRSSKTGEFSFPSRKVSECTKEVIASIKKKRAQVATASALAVLKNNVLGFSQIMQELEVRTLSVDQEEVLKNLFRWGTTTVFVERNFNLSKIELRDSNQWLFYDGGTLKINGARYLHGSYGDCSDFETRTSTVTPTVIY